MKHTLKGVYETKIIYLDDTVLNIALSQHVRKYSTEFDWGDRGPGASQLALAIVLQLTGTFQGHTKLKNEVICGLPKKNFKIEFDLENEKIREKLIRHVHAVNKALPYEYVSLLSNMELLANVHPMEREALSEEIGILIK